VTTSFSGAVAVLTNPSAIEPMALAVGVTAIESIVCHTTNKVAGPLNAIQSTPGRVVRGSIVHCVWLRD
jgi:hypothetical protein